MAEEQDSRARSIDQYREWTPERPQVVNACATASFRPQFSSYTGSSTVPRRSPECSFYLGHSVGPSPFVLFEPFFFCACRRGRQRTCTLGSLITRSPQP